jgi:hypothetical protein
MVTIRGREIAVPEAMSYLVEPPSSRAFISTALSRRQFGELQDGRVDSTLAIPKAVGRRFSGLVVAELSDALVRPVRADWLGRASIPRFVVSFRYDGLDAFGIADTTARLDLAARRAAALQRRIITGRPLEEWPRAIRTTRGGLYLLDVRRGSFEAVLTVWGDLVTIAGSTPVSIASFFALAWEMGQGARRITERWTGRESTARAATRPTPDANPNGTEWSLAHTKSLAPVLIAAIENGQGVEFHLKDQSLEIKLTVYSKDETSDR